MPGSLNPTIRHAENLRKKNPRESFPGVLEHLQDANKDGDGFRRLECDEVTGINDQDKLSIANRLRRFRNDNPQRNVSKRINGYVNDSTRWRMRNSPEYISSARSENKTGSPRCIPPPVCVCVCVCVCVVGLPFIPISPHIVAVYCFVGHSLFGHLSMNSWPN